MRITYFHRNKASGFSIQKVTQAVICKIQDREEFYVPNKDASITGIIKNLIYVYRHRNKRGINHITGDIHYCILSLIGCMSVLTIHDTVGLDFRKTSKLKRKFIELFWYKLPLKFASKIICISQETKDHVSKYTNRNDILVIPDAIDPQKFEERNIIPKKAISIPFKVLLIGTKINKNLEMTFQALHGLDCEVTIVGKLSEHQKNCLKFYSIKYINKWNLTEDELVDVYINTDIVSFCSLFEGFGMPAIEANLAKRPLLCSKIPVLRRIAGDSGLFVDPYNVEDMRSGFLKLSRDKELREYLVNNGIKNATKYLPETIRKQWIEVYDLLSNQ